MYPNDSFAPGVFPTNDVPYWMLLNRTCHMYVSGGRENKLPYLNYAAVYPLHRFVSYERDSKSLKNQVSWIVNGKHESSVFLPKVLALNVTEPLVANLNLVYTVVVAKCPPAGKKALQLSSPFSEYVFQRFARYFYTVGYDDEHLKADANIRELVDYLEQQAPQRS